MTAITDVEFVDVFDDVGVHVGTSGRRTVHQNGAWHRCIHCIVLARRGRRLTLTLQRRGHDLDEYPGLIDVSVAGHLHAGESTEDATRREIREELGIDVEFEALKPVGEYRLVVQTPELFSRELTNVFILRDDRPLSAFSFDKFEVDSLVSIDVADACALWLGQQARVAVTEWRSARSTSRTAEAADFVRDAPDYWRWLATVLRNCGTVLTTRSTR
jgi:isopentenyldiphosphate isomerase